MVMVLGYSVLAFMMSLKMRCRVPVFMSIEKAMRLAGVKSGVKYLTGSDRFWRMPTTPFQAMSRMVSWRTLM